LALSKTRKTSSFDGADVNEYIIAAVVWLYETEALLGIEPLNGTCRHFLLQSAHKRVPRDNHAITFNFVDVFGKGARGRIQQGTAADRTFSIYIVIAFFARKEPILFQPSSLWCPLGRLRKDLVDVQAGFID
jgi:hypothetical protein